MCIHVCRWRHDYRSIFIRAEPLEGDRLCHCDCGGDVRGEYSRAAMAASQVCPPLDFLLLLPAAKSDARSQLVGRSRYIMARGTKDLCDCRPCGGWLGGLCDRAAN